MAREKVSKVIATHVASPAIPHENVGKGAAKEVDTAKEVDMARAKAAQEHWTSSGRARSSP